MKFSIKKYIQISVCINILTKNYSDISSSKEISYEYICMFHFLETNLFGYSFVSKSIRMSHSGLFCCVFCIWILEKYETEITKKIRRVGQSTMRGPFSERQLLDTGIFSSSLLSSIATIITTRFAPLLDHLAFTSKKWPKKLLRNSPIVVEPYLSIN